MAFIKELHGWPKYSKGTDYSTWIGGSQASSDIAAPISFGPKTDKFGIGVVCLLGFQTSDPAK